MPLLLQKDITEHTKLAVWKIEEDETFFLEKVAMRQVIHHSHKRLQHLAGRYLLSLLFARFPYEDILINKAGKPYLISDEYQFSISHCGNYAAAIISTQQQPGIDIELFSPKTEKVKHKYLNDDELAYLASLQEANEHRFGNYELYTICWCAKEAVYKWWGNGKIDFKQNIIISRINIAQQTIEVLFIKLPLYRRLMLSLVLQELLSIVWTVTAKNY